MGVITLSRAEPRPFTERQIGLIETFAAQAVIAMENARLLTELRESLEQQTATSDVLKTISRSSVELEAVLETLVETVARLCRADQAYMFRQEDELYHLVAAHGLSDEARAFVVTHPIAPEDRRTVSGRVALERRTVHIADVLEDPATAMEGSKLPGYRTMLGIPLLRESTLIGIFNVARTRVEPFTDKEIELASQLRRSGSDRHRECPTVRGTARPPGRAARHLRQHGRRRGHVRRRTIDWPPGTETSRRSSACPRRCLAERPSYAEYLRLLADRGEFGTENVEAELAEPPRRHRPRAAARAHTRRWDGDRGAPQRRAGRRLRADLQRCHRAKASRGGDPRCARCRRGGAGAADGYGRHPQGHRQFADRRATGARRGGEGGGAVLRGDGCDRPSA